MKKTSLLLALILMSVLVFAQKPKEIKELNIKTKTTWITEKKNGKDFNYKAMELRYDKNGMLIQQIAYNKKGKVIENISNLYQDNHKIREIHLDDTGKIISRIEYIYTNELLTEMGFYNADGKLYRKEQYIFEHQD